MSTKLKLNWFDTILYLPLISLFTAAFVIPGWDKKVVILFSVSIIAIICKYGLNTIKENYKDPYVVILIISALYGSALYETIGYGSGEIRTLIVVSIFLLTFPRERINIQGLPLLLLIGAIISFLYTLYFSVYLDIPRSKQPINAIPFAITLCLLATVSLFIFFKERRIITLLSFFLLAISIIITETRGAIIPLTVSSSILLLYKIFERNNIKKLITTSIFGTFFIISLSYGFVEARVNATVAEIQSISEGNYNTSIGLRLQMWQASPELISINPIFGLGDNHKQELQRLYKAGKIDKSLAKYSPTHYHNQYIDKIIKSGVIGFILFLLAVYYPIYACFIKANENSNKECIIAITAAFSLICLTDSPFSQTFTLYPLLLINYFILNSGFRRVA
ncbi:O-antigen ligase family protein [Photobacterium sp. DA100]|uniref:O-antigen ligase family protein n=1 Tax=Photobacterium sp. DA100 TaxID=3027472 RepID=UPI002478C68C|nr:O-antigen ligase family protein [Photobacterium sp. DA100]WEM42438.1 O-antigen ligase family protein [Photobacterium sp. DA100]